MSKKLLFFILLCIGCFCTACGKKVDAGNEADLKLKWLLPAETEEIDKKQEELVEQELGKFFEDVPVQIDLCFVNQETYVEQITKILQTEQDWDLMFLDQELNQVMRNETKKFFAPVTDLLMAEYPQLYEAIPEYAWDVMTVNKEIYAIPNRHCWAGQEGYYVREDYLNAYGKGLKADKVSEFYQIDTFLENVTGQEEGIGTYIPENRWQQELLSHGFYFSGGLETLGVVRKTADGYVAENMFETAEFEEYCQRMRNWYLEGYIREDSVVRDTNEAVILQDQKNGLFALEPAEDFEPRIHAKLEEAYGGAYTFEVIPTSEVMILPNKVTEYSTAFNANSEHLSEALAVVEKLCENQEMYNLILYGIEGKHYEKVNDRQIRKIADSGYGPDDGAAVGSYALGNQYLSYLMEEEAYDQWESMEVWEAKAKLPETMGFYFRTTNVSDEIRNVSAIIESELRLLETGSVDVDTFLPEFQGKLREAGAYRIMTEYQSQLTRWINNKSEY